MKGFSMTDPKFKRIKANYRKNAFEITLQEGKTRKNYIFPFALLTPPAPESHNRVISYVIDAELRDTVVRYILADGAEGEIPSDFVLYHCEPAYEWSPVNQIKRALKGGLGKSLLSVQVVADGLRTCPSEVLRLFEDNLTSTTLPEVLKLASRAGYRLEFRLKKKPAA
jgi:hypothetical protein